MGDLKLCEYIKSSYFTMECSDYIFMCVCGDVKHHHNLKKYLWFSTKKKKKKIYIPSYNFELFFRVFR